MTWLRPEGHRLISFLVVGDGYPASRVAISVAALSGARLAGLATERPTPEAAVALPNGTRVEAVTKFLTTRSGIARARQLGADWLLCIGCTVILPPRLLALFGGHALNCHPGPLPEYAGLHVHQWAIRNGETEFGATVHRLEPRLDAGPIVASTRFPIRDEDTGFSLFHRTQRAAAELMMSVVGRIVAGERLQFVNQDLSRRHLYRHRDALDGRINWHLPARSVINFIRAGNYEPCKSPTYVARFDTAACERVEVLLAVVAGRTDRPPGSLIALAREGPIIACGEGTAVQVIQARIGEHRVDDTVWRQCFGAG
jgi:methionyl-tRNA formyltransferase